MNKMDDEKYLKMIKRSDEEIARHPENSYTIDEAIEVIEARRTLNREYKQVFTEKNDAELKYYKRVSDDEFVDITKEEFENLPENKN